MRVILLCVFLAILSLNISSISYAEEIQIIIDGVSIATDVEPEIKNNRTMVPLRAISENLGANVEWSNSKVTLTKSDMKFSLNLNSTVAETNGEKVLLDAKPYMINNRIFVPLRFIAETFDCNVSYNSFIVTIFTKPLEIAGMKVKALQHEYRMTMGGVVQQIDGNAYNETIYNIFVENKGEKVEAPDSYSWSINTDTPGSYYKNGQYDFLDHKGNSLLRFDIYTLNPYFPTEILSRYPEVLIYDPSEDEWYLFSETAKKTINILIDTASKNGFLTIISNTAV